MMLLMAFAFCLLIQLYFFLFVFGKYAWVKEPLHAKVPGSSFQKSVSKEEYQSVSVVIAACNEAENLSENLKYIASQDYPDYEIILVDDGSSDRTDSILEKFLKEHSSDERPVYVIKIAPEDSKGKKQALAAGIEKAVKEIILVTDADCVPLSSRWIEEMTSPIRNGFELVLGYGPYKKISGSFLNKLIRYETLITAIQYFSYALHGLPYMGVGRNMAYTKSLYEQANGFLKHQQVRSGDDDLFVNQVANQDNTTICDHPDSFTLSKPKLDMASWIRQKRRHITTASHYRPSQQIRLAMFYLSQIGFYALGLALLITGSYTLVVISLIMTRFVAYYLIIGRSAKRLDEKDLLSLAPLYEISIIFMQLYVFTYNKVSPPKHW